MTLDNSESICSFCTYINSSQAVKCQICQKPLRKIDFSGVKNQQSQLKTPKTLHKLGNLINFNFLWKFPLLKNAFDINFFQKAVLIGLIILGSIEATSKVTKLVFPINFNQQLSAAKPKTFGSKDDIKIYETMKEVPNVPKGIFDYGGAICFAALQRDGMNDAISSAHNQFKLRYVEPKSSNPGCTTGINMLLSSELSFAQNSRPLTDSEIASAMDRRFKLESIPVAIDGIVFYTNKSLGIKSLSIAQIRDIYGGKVKNWQELGGKNLPIVPVSLDPKIDSILRLLTKTEEIPEITKDAIIVRDYTSAIRKTGTTKGAISYASAAILRGQSSVEPIALSVDDSSPSIAALLADGTVNLQAFENNLYPLTRRLFVNFRRDGTPDELAGVAYANFLLSNQGQKIVEKAGFVPLYLRN